MGSEVNVASTTERGYGYAHKKLRKEWVALVEQGGVHCARCSKPIEPGSPFDLDHNEDRTGYIGVSCRPCNRATMTHEKQKHVSGYEWF